MRFAYYERLNARERRIYDASDRVTALPLSDTAVLAAPVDELHRALASEKRAAVQRAANALADALLSQLGVPGVRVRVLSVRPSSAESELHGLYERELDDGSAEISVWMRTAAKKRVVAFRTFVRTLLHELCHHLDYDHLKLKDSFHTQGFFRREASLARQLLGERSEPVLEVPAETPKPKRRRRAEQLELPFASR